jgi:hypothetical protein
MQPLGVYFIKNENNALLPNRNLGFTKAHHLVLSYDQSLPGNWHLKPELYYQALFDAPVRRDAQDAFSLLNVYDGFVGEILVNGGKGRNYGVELTAEKFLSKGFYFLLSASLFQSEYQGSDGVWRNSRFNSKFVNSLVTGKEWNLRKNRSFGVNLKLTWMGGHRETPIDLPASIAKGETVYDESRAFSDRMPNYFRLDTGFKLKRNFERLTTTLALDIQNTSNRENIFGRYYDDKSKTIKYWYQAPLIPILSYRVEFLTYFFAKTTAFAATRRPVSSINATKYTPSDKSPKSTRPSAVSRSSRKRPSASYTRAVTGPPEGRPLQRSSPPVGLGENTTSLSPTACCALPTVSTYTVLHFVSEPYWLLTVRHTS